MVGASGRKSAPGMNATMRQVADKIPAAAAAMLLHMGAPDACSCHVCIAAAAAAGGIAQDRHLRAWASTVLRDDPLPHSFSHHAHCCSNRALRDSRGRAADSASVPKRAQLCGGDGSRLRRLLGAPRPQGELLLLLLVCLCCFVCTVLYCQHIYVLVCKPGMVSDRRAQRSLLTEQPLRLAPCPQTEEAVHAMRSYVDHLCGTTVPALLQLQGGWFAEQVG